MFFRNDLIKIHLMVLTIVFFLHYSDLKETTVLKRSSSANTIKEQTNHFGHKSTNYKYMQQKRIRNLKTPAQVLKHKLNDQILQQKLQLVQAETKKSLLKLQNSYLENFYISDSKNQTKKAMQRKSTLQNHKTNTGHLLRNRRDDGAIDERDVEESITTEGTKQILEEIVEDLDDIRESSIGSIQGKICQLNGTWISDTIGIGFNISFHQNIVEYNTTPSTNCSTTTTPKSENLTEETCTGGEVEITSFDVQLDENSDHLKLINCSWDISAKIPFSHTTMLIVTALYEPQKYVAVFVGQCRYCDKTEMVMGQWMIHKFAHDCRKIGASQDVFGDALRRQPRT